MFYNNIIFFIYFYYFIFTYKTIYYYNLKILYSCMYMCINYNYILIIHNLFLFNNYYYKFFKRKLSNII